MLTSGEHFYSAEAFVANSYLGVFRHEPVPVLLFKL